MNTECPLPLPCTSLEDPLLQLELEVARRADELARTTLSGPSTQRDRETWERAENEFFRLDQPASVTSGAPNLATVG